MAFLFLFAAILTTIVGNLSGNPNQGSHAHKQQIANYMPEKSILVASTIENPQRGEPAQTAAIKTPWGDITSEWMLVIVGVITCGVIGWQSCETRRAANIAKESIVLTHRPKIIIRSIVIPWMQILNRHTSDKTILTTVLIRPDLNQQKIEGFLYAINVGNQPATLRTLDECMFFGETLPMERPYEPSIERRPINNELQAGESRKITLTPKQTSSMELAMVSTNEPPFYVIGRIIYADSFGNLRETGFCRRADYKAECFVVVDNPDYEYSD